MYVYIYTYICKSTATTTTTLPRPTMTTYYYACHHYGSDPWDDHKGIGTAVLANRVHRTNTQPDRHVGRSAKRRKPVLTKDSARDDYSTRRVAPPKTQWRVLRKVLRSLATA